MTWLNVGLGSTFDHLPTTGFKFLEADLEVAFGEINRSESGRVETHEATLAQCFLSFAQLVERVSCHGEDCRVVFDSREIGGGLLVFCGGYFVAD